MAGQVLNSLVVTFNTVRIMGAASQNGLSLVKRKATHIDSDGETCAAVRLDQGPFLQVFPLQHEHKVCIRLCRGCESLVAIRGPGRTLRRNQDIGVVMRPEPFVSHASQERISPDEDVLPLTRQTCMGAAGNGKMDAGARCSRGASFQIEQNGEKTRECDGRANLISLSHGLGL